MNIKACDHCAITEGDIKVLQVTVIGNGPGKYELELCRPCRDIVVAGITNIMKPKALVVSVADTLDMTCYREV